MAINKTCPNNQCIGPFPVPRHSIVSVSVTGGGTARLTYTEQAPGQTGTWALWPKGPVTTDAPVTDVARDNYLVQISCSGGVGTLQISDPDPVNSLPPVNWLSQAIPQTGIPLLAGNAYKYLTNYNGTTLATQSIVGSMTAPLNYVPGKVFDVTKLRQGPSTMPILSLSTLIGSNHNYPLDLHGVGLTGIGIGLPGYPNQMDANTQSFYVNNCAGLGMQPIVNMNGAKNGTSFTGGTTVSIAVASTDLYSAWVTSVVRANSSKVNIWQVRNEGYGVMGPTALVDELKIAYPLIKGNNPNALVMATCDLQLGGSLGRATFLDALIDAKALDYIDIWGFHCYNNNVWPEVNFANEAYFIVDKILAMKPDMKIALSETGWTTIGTGAFSTNDTTNPQLTQGQYMARNFIMAATLPNAYLAGMYEWKDNSGDHLGIINATNGAQSSFAFVYWTCTELAQWDGGHAEYTRGQFTGRNMNKTSVSWIDGNSQFGGDMQSCPRYVRGSIDGNDRLFAWMGANSSFADTNTYTDRILVDCYNIDGGTLNIRYTSTQASTGVAPSTFALSYGRNTLPVSLDGTPILLYASEQIKFPEFQS